MLEVITRLTFYEDGAIEAECNKLPCGHTSTTCVDNQPNCRAETDVVTGMKWAPNGQSVLLRCCHLSAPTRLYVGTDRVTLGSYYTGGLVEEKDLYGKDGETEFDFISNLRTEQGAVRIWVYRVMCPKNSSHLVYEEHGKITDGRAFAFEKRRQYLLKQLDGQTDNAKNLEAEDNESTAPSSTTSRPFNPLRYTPANYKPNRKPTGPLNSVERLL
uniref:Eukaryotic translation initiation factor 2A n=1 Tax=Syphacia muris TaxID=451379 RepID=A0A0N5A9Z3_9BILA